MAYTTINKSGDYFNTKLYTGNGSTQNITGVGFQPDFIWQKERSSTSYHVLTDAVRGNTKQLFSNATAAEATDSNYITSFASDGFGQGQNDDTNQNSQTYASWNWKANGAGSANTDGTITSTVSANTTAGMSIATWSGTGSNASIGHGLGGVDCMIIKNTNSSRDFYFWNKTMVYNTRLSINTTSAFTTGTDNMTALPDATKINMAVSTQNNGSSQNYVGYFFQEKTGYSKFGSYVGNGNANGAFIYTGFKPAFFMAKRTSASGDPWVLIDNKRNTFNALSNTLTPSDSNAENTGTDRADFLSNGIKIKTTSDAWNGSGSSYIYMAFADAPLVGTNNVPANAR